MAELTQKDLIDKYGPPGALTNSIVIKMCKDSATLPSLTRANWFICWCGDTNIPVSALASKMHRISQKALKLRKESLEVFNKEIFIPPQPAESRPVSNTQNSQPFVDLTNENLQSPLMRHTSPPRHSKRKKIETPTKKLNTAKHAIVKAEKHIATLEKQLKQLKKEVHTMTLQKTLCCVKNVKRRDKRNADTRAKLRAEKTQHLALSKRFERENYNLKSINKALSNENIDLKKKNRIQRKKLNALRKEKKRALDRAWYHLQRRRGQRKNEDDDGQKEFHEKDTELELKRKDGEYSEEARFCVLELTGLEVATGKIRQVMETVGDMCGVRFTSLPSRTACQKIVDEGQVLAKNYIMQRVLKRCKGFGIHKDGTTRRKVKILDTSINTEEGDKFCLGWSSVASETGKAIAEDTKQKLKEVVGENSNDMEDLLEKLTYYMNDRAANERKSSDLLDEWRDGMLKDESQPLKKVQHLHCAAHLLLGFHTYVLNELSKLDVIPKGEFKHPISIFLRDASDAFGPVGDYRGLKNHWDALCIDKNIKSTIKNYKDNRFNGLFEVAAQVFHHHKDFLFLLDSLPSKNTKLTKVYNNLKNPTLLLLTECLGMAFHKITGPFWAMIISSNVTHEKFKSIVQKLIQDLQKCQDNPHCFFKPESFSFLNFSTTSSETSQSLSKSSSGKTMETFMKAICTGILTALKTQLKDVLSDVSLKVDVVAPLTNLTSERHFGHLDSSQRRRPHCSLHHHSSVILLKQTRKRLREWFNELPDQEKKKMWKRARHEGKEMRQKHQERDKDAIMESLKLKMRTVGGKDEDDDDDEDGKECIGDVLKADQMIAVACLDAWYPALVKKECLAGDDVLVSFGELGKTLGAFRWPTDKDVHTISRRSVVSTNVNIEPRAAGRSWVVTNASEIQAQFKKFK